MKDKADVKHRSQKGKGRPKTSSHALDLDVQETTERPVMSCYALDLDVQETTERPVMSCYALDLDEGPEVQ